MSATKALAYVLSTQDYRDTSLLVELYTRDWGKVRGIIRGVRDARARYGSTLEPFSLNEILFYRRRRGGDLHQVTQVELVDDYTDVREDLERLSYASYFTELLNRLVEPEEISPETFDLYRDALEFLRDGASPKRAARLYELKLLEVLGHLPELRACVVCRAEPDPAYFNPAFGGVHCRTCAVAGAARVADGGRGMPVSRRTLQFLDRALRSDLRGMKTAPAAPEVGPEAEKLLRRFIDFHVDVKLKSLVFLDKMGFN
ncbi:MAG: DNA repair protein RecO [Candidatus Omnitrophica bacterium]|nr:DNA repair protein RecO [Candidatus Omnitrophota bacterium]